MKSKYETHVLPNMEKITAWAREGVTIKDIAKKLRIADSTLRKYLDDGEKGDERYAALSAAFAQSCAVADDKVEHALFDRACGYTATERVYETRYNADTGEYEDICVKRTDKHIPPDPTSAMFWLTNRRPDRWQYRPQAEQADRESERGVIVIPEVSENG